MWERKIDNYFMFDFTNKTYAWDFLQLRFTFNKCLFGKLLFTCEIFFVFMYSFYYFISI